MSRGAPEPEPSEGPGWEGGRGLGKGGQGLSAPFSGHFDPRGHGGWRAVGSTKTNTRGAGLCSRAGGARLFNLEPEDELFLEIKRV